MICPVVNPDFTKSSAFSLISITTVIKVSSTIAKKKVVKNFLRIYQSSFLITAEVEKLRGESTGMQNFENVKLLIHW